MDPSKYMLKCIVVDVKHICIVTALMHWSNGVKPCSKLLARCYLYLLFNCNLKCIRESEYFVESCMDVNVRQWVDQLVYFGLDTALLVFK